MPPLRRRPSFSAQPHGLPPLPPLPGQPSFSAGSHPLPMPPMRPFSSQGSYPSSMPPRQSSSFPPESLPQRPLQRRPCFTSQPGPGAGPSQPLTPAKPTAKPAVFPPVYMVMGWNWKVLRVSVGVQLSYAYHFGLYGFVPGKLRLTLTPSLIRTLLWRHLHRNLTICVVAGFLIS